MLPMESARYDTLVVGAGPAGASAAYWLARHGHSVLVVDKKRFPREKTCGDGLTPRAVRQLDDMGLGSALEGFQRYEGLRSMAHGVTLELRWPSHPDFPDYGYVVRRRDLDEMVADRAVKAGATLWPASEAVAPLVEGGLVTGATIRRAESGVTETVRARIVVVADGANSRFGRALGTQRDRSYPMGMAIRGYFTSPYHDEPWIESHLDLRDRDGNYMPGYGWIFPVGDGTINVGVGPPRHLHRVQGGQHHQIDGRLHARPRRPVGASRRRRPAVRRPAASCPTGGSVTPKAGPTWIVAGDAAGSINPFNGEGIAYAYETGRMVADAVDETLVTGDGLALARYPDQLDARYGEYFKVARTFVKVIGNPAVDARADPGRDAVPHAHGVGAADHGEPPAPRRDRPRRGGLQGGRAARRGRARPVPGRARRPRRS